jgi:hypothetical protein
MRALILSSAPLVQSLALIAMSVLGSGVIALMEFGSSSTVRWRAHWDALKSNIHLPAPTGRRTASSLKSNALPIVQFRGPGRPPFDFPAMIRKPGSNDPN